MCLFFLEDSMHLEAKEVYLLFSSLDSKWAHLVRCEEIFNSGFELLTPLWQAILGSYSSAIGHAARRQFMLLGDGSRCSVTVHAAQQFITLVGPWVGLLGVIRTCSDELKMALHNGYKALGD